MTMPATAPASTPAGQPSGDAAPVVSPAAPVTAASGSEPTKVAEEKKEAKTSILGDPPKDPKEAKVETKTEEKPKGDAAAELEIKLPEGAKLDDAALKGYRDAFKEKGITDGELASKIVAMDLERKTAEHEVWDKQGKAWESQLKTELGEKYDAAVVKAKSALERFGGEDARKEIVALGIGNLPGLVKAWAAVGEAMSEDTSTSKGAPAAPASKPLTRAEHDKKFYSQNS